MKRNVKRAWSWLSRDLSIGFVLCVAVAASVTEVHAQRPAFEAEDLGVVRSSVGELNNRSGQSLAVVLNRDDEVVVHGFKSTCRPETSLAVSDSTQGVAIGGDFQVVTSSSQRTTIGADPCVFLDGQAPMATLPTPAEFALLGTQPRAMNANNTVVGSGQAFVTAGAAPRDLPIRWASTTGFAPTILQTVPDSLGFPKAGAALAIND